MVKSRRFETIVHQDCEQVLTASNSTGIGLHPRATNVHDRVPCDYSAVNKRHVLQVGGILEARKMTLNLLLVTRYLQRRAVWRGYLEVHVLLASDAEGLSRIAAEAGVSDSVSLQCTRSHKTSC